MEDYPNKELVDRFVKKIIRYSGEDKDKIASAAVYASRKHGDQKRKSGEPYIIHPIAVAEILMQNGMDADTVCAGLLHDCLEDTDTTEEELATIFGKDVAEMVQGVTKITRITKEKSIQEADTIKKMFFAMSKNMRVIIIKLADKLHNMRTIDGLSPERKRAFAQDCLDIFAPIADSLGMSTIKCELEDLSLKALKPESFNFINDYLLERKSEYTAYIKQVSKTIEEACRKVGITDITINGRVKHAYSIYQKIKKRKKEIDEIYDILGIRVICQTQVECYSILGVIHSTWIPIEGRFKDYIAMPKANNYQSLHTTVLGPQSKHLEIQIRTREMHLTAEKGVAAHWEYKASSGAESGVWKKMDSINQQKMLNKIKGWTKEIEQSDDFMEEIKNELLKDSIVVFTPQGHVIELPVGSTALDFAFKVHTEVGVHCSGAKADGAIIPLNKPLGNTQIIEILTSPNAHPNQQWLEYAQTTSAKKKIKAWLNKNEATNIPIAPQLKVVVNPNPTPNADLITRNTVVTAQGLRFSLPDHKGSIVIGDNSNVLYDFAKCCNPVHGDPIIAYITRGRGYVIHKQDCPNLKNMPESAQRQVQVEWNASDLVRRFKVVAEPNIELLEEINNAARKNGARLTYADLPTAKDQKVGKNSGTFTISADSEDALRKTVGAIRSIPAIKHIEGF